MLAYATTKISVIRGSITDDYGDEIDTVEPVHRNINASLIERHRTTFDLVSGTPRRIKTFSCRVDPRADIQQDDRIVDQKDNAIYAIDDIYITQSPTNISDMRLELMKIN